MRALLISTYDLGRQPFGLASAAAALTAAGIGVRCADLAKERLAPDAVRDADAVAFFLPMHTATRLALPVIDTVRGLNPRARVIAYGLYAPLNADLLRARGVDTIIGGEFEDDLVAALQPAPVVVAPDARRDAVPRVTFRIPLRESLPPLARYASLQVGDERRIAGYTEASRGCKHRCRHCPIVPVYDGRFRIVPVEVVIADAQAQVAAGARHITFGDPDFFNGTRHAIAVMQAFRDACPGVTYDATIKIEHLLHHADLIPLLAETGCAFVTSAVESIDDEVLAKLEKGHTRADFEAVVQRFREAHLPLVPTFVAFTPWITLEGYCELLREIDRLDLVDAVPPIQLAIRLLIPQGSRLLELQEVSALVERFDETSLTYTWRHRDPRVDALQARIQSLVGARINAPRRETFAAVWDLAHDAAGLRGMPRTTDLVPRATIPYLNEPWYC